MTRYLCALLLLVGMTSTALADEQKPPTAILLVAREALPDPNFGGSVVLVMNNLGPGPGGVILNRPTRMAVSHLFPELPRLAALDDKLHFGGPVGLPAVSYLFRADTAPANATRVLDGVYFGTDRDLLLKLLGREKPMEGLRIFTGLSGWAPGQLENEIARGDWRLAPADADAIFERRPPRPWPEREPADAGQRT
jgi:putative transcriptional regulator